MLQVRMQRSSYICYIDDIQKLHDRWRQTEMEPSKVLYTQHKWNILIMLMIMLNLKEAIFNWSDTSVGITTKAAVGDF